MMLEQNLLSRFVIGASFAPLYYPKYKKSEILSPKIKIFSKKFPKKIGAAPIWDGSMRQSAYYFKGIFRVGKDRFTANRQAISSDGNR